MEKLNTHSCLFIEGKMLLEIKGRKNPNGETLNELNWLAADLHVWEEQTKISFPLELFSWYDLEDWFQWMQSVLHAQEYVNDFQLMDAFHRFKRVKRGNHTCVKYIYDEFDESRIHIEFTLEEIRELCLQTQVVQQHYPKLWPASDTRP